MKNSSWGIMGVMILVLISITDYIIPEEFYITSLLGEKIYSLT